ncbi:MAG: homoserine dehydrogenase [Acidobacteria bacterium]|nr:homoserine dehydrogenase [Acidobacteriota bacterium]
MRADIALIGYGHVARRFERMLDEQREALAQDHGLSCDLVATATRHGCVAGGEPCADAFEAIRYVAGSPADLRVVIELTTLNVIDGEPAISHIRSAIDAGCHVITANKGPVAFAYQSLRDAAEKAGVSFLFEGTVMDGVPVFSLVRETMPGVRIAGFEGVINTTTNHILASMERGLGFDEALAQMQADGIAESDASLDVDGWDAAAKTAVLANALMDARMTPLDVERTGISEADRKAVHDARERGNHMKLVASARRAMGGGISARVALRELPATHLLGGLDGGANALILQTDLLDRVAVCELSGDLTQTAYAVFADLVTISRRVRKSR